MDAVSRVELAQRLYREYRTACFWHCKPDLVITESLIPFVIKGLRDNGGRKAFLASAALQSGDDSESCR